MTLVVEDGTGLELADSYGSVAAADTYHTSRGNAAWALLSATAKEVALRVGSAYVDSIQRYKGVRLTAIQALEFPRSGCYDWSGREAVGVPARVRHAAFELALRASAGDLYADLARGGQVRSETVGPISTTYADGAPPGTWYTAAMNLLAPFSRASGPRMGGPGYAAPVSDPQFSVGMNDMPVGMLVPTTGGT